MNTSSSAQRFEVYDILPHPHETQVLMLREAEGWSLPHLLLTAPVHSEIVNAAMQQALDIDSTTLRCINSGTGSLAQHQEAVYVLESHSPFRRISDGAA